MRAYISECKHAITPFHVPKTTVVFPRHPRIAQTLFNHQDALKQWATRQEPTCKCELIKKFAPKAPTFGGHVAAKGIELTHHLSSLEKQLASGSVTDTFFPDKAQLHTHFVDAWSSWCRNNALPGPPRGLNVVFAQIWHKHLTQVQDRYHREAVDNLKSKTRGTVWHTEDHHPRTAICFCPTLYHRMLEGTFGNPQVFQEVPRMFEEQVKKVQKAAKRDLQRRYPWAFRRTPVIPRAYALPKRKKDFASGRPIVSFVDAFMRPLLEATSRLLHRICSLAFPRAFSKGDVYELLRQVREFFEFGTAEPLHCRNQDLAGFFNSISQSQFLQAWRITLEFYRQRHGAQLETTFSVNLKEQAQQLRVFRGRRRTRASREVVLWCEDIPTIIRHALALQHFQVSTRNFRQCFGSPMGSPLSPALCGMVIAAQEEIWRRTFNISCSNMSRSLLGLRYVDNRLWLSESRFEQLPGIRLLLNNYFYGGSIILEEEPAFEFVGFTLDFEQRRILYSRACTTHDIPSTKSAAPQAVLLSGVLARAHTIKKCSHPGAQALMDLRYLWDLAEQRGLPIHSFDFKAKFWKFT